MLLRFRPSVNKRYAVTVGYQVVAIVSITCLQFIPLASSPLRCDRRAAYPKIGNVIYRS